MLETCHDLSMDIAIRTLLLKEFIIMFIWSCARQNDVNACPRQENWQYERFACFRQKEVNDKTPTFQKYQISILNKIAWCEMFTNKTYKW